MKGVVLLSELHPLAWSLFNPIKQASEWFGLLTPEDLDWLKQQGSVSYAKVIGLIEQRCTERGSVLVLRDWAHLDFTGHPFVSTPSFRPLLHAELVGSFEIIRSSTSRNPVSQWQSLTQLGVMQEPLRTGVFNLDIFLAGYRKYADLCVETGFIRYEDLLMNPDVAMRQLCDSLDIEFDPSYADKWHAYERITGDVNNPRASNAIKMPPSRPVPPELLNRFLANADYRQACELLRYSPLQG
jgi:hypothetical protein